MAKTLQSFARKQAEEEKKESEVTPPKETETTTETESEESEETESEETETTTETEAADKKSAAALQPGQVAINASDLKKLRADADAWNKNKAQFATLTDWHKSMKEAGANVPGKEDTTNHHEKGASSVSDQPWNKKASEVYGKSAKKS
ncbi:hypothetical protein GCM10027347_17560 [Larkinella harenae]